MINLHFFLLLIISLNRNGRTTTKTIIIIRVQCGELFFHFMEDEPGLRRTLTLELWLLLLLPNYTIVITMTISGGANMIMWWRQLMMSLLQWLFQACIIVPVLVHPNSKFLNGFSFLLISLLSVLPAASSCPLWVSPPPTTAPAPHPTCIHLFLSLCRFLFPWLSRGDPRLIRTHFPS